MKGGLPLVLQILSATFVAVVDLAEDVDGDGVGGYQRLRVEKIRLVVRLHAPIAAAAAAAAAASLDGACDWGGKAGWGG